MNPAWLGETLRAARERLIRALKLEPRVASLEAQSLLAAVLKRTRAYLLAHPETVLSAPHQAQFEALLSRREQGEPIAYLIGQREFYGLDFLVTPDVLIPRPETELLVDLALDIVPPHQPTRVLDLGTGSGAIAITLAQHRPQAQITAIDASAAALAIARQNATRLNTPNIAFLESDWFAGLVCTSRFDLIVSNPPYVAQSDPHLFSGDVRFEPTLALSSGPDGLNAIRHIVHNARAFLNVSGHLLFEHGFDQEAACARLLHECGYIEITQHRDLSGQPRISGGKIP